jgi:hypothetical protein
MHVLDGARAGPPNIVYAAFPGEGYYPRELIRPHYAWSLHLNQSKVKVGGKDDVKVRIVRLDDMFVESGEVPATVVSIATGAGQNWNTVIFRPELKGVAAGKYWVEVGGILDNRGKPAPLAYLVDFIDMPAASEEKLAEKLADKSPAVKPGK